MGTLRVRPGRGLFQAEALQEVWVEELGATFRVLPLTDKLQRKFLRQLDGQKMPLTQTRSGEVRVEMTLDTTRQREAVVELRREVIKGWADDFEDAAGTLIPFTPENLDVLVEEDDICEPVMAAARKLAVERDEDAAGN